jgi:hypothetical protein
MSELQKQLLAKHIIETEEFAAEYAGVNVQTLRQWVRNGMPMTADGGYLKPWLDLYLRTNGNPTDEDRQDTLARYPELSITKPKKATQDGSAAESQMSPDESQPDSEAPGSEEMDAETKKILDEIDTMLEKE